MTAQLEHDVVMPADDAHDAGFAKGWVARGEVQNADDCYLPVPLAWRLVNVGDVVVSPDGRLWTVEQLGPNAHRRVGVVARCGGTTMTAGVERGDIGLDPDAQVLVLEAAPLATAEAVVRAQFTDARTLARTETRGTT